MRGINKNGNWALKKKNISAEVKLLPLHTYAWGSETVSLKLIL